MAPRARRGRRRPVHHLRHHGRTQARHAAVGRSSRTSRPTCAPTRAGRGRVVWILPLPWIMEQVYVVAMPLLCRIRVSFPESAETAMPDLREIGPTHLLLAPRVWEQTAADIRARIMDANPLTRAPVRLGGPARRASPGAGVAAHRLADLLLFAPLRDRLGFARVRSAATGGAALGPDTFQLLPRHGRALAPALRPDRACRRLHAAGRARDRLRQLGRAFDDTEMRIVDPDEQGVGEIVTRHPGMFRAISATTRRRARSLTRGRLDAHRRCRLPRRARAGSP